MKPKAAKTKWGAVSFEYTENVPTGWGNRSVFTTDKVNVFLNGEDVGLLKMKYIKKDTIEKEIKNVLEFQIKFGGWKHLQKAYDGNNTKELIIGMYNSMLDAKKLSMEDLNDLPASELKELFSQLYERVVKEYQSDYDEFIDLYQDRPMVDYIEVNKRGGGMGFALYIAGAKWMAEKGMVLCASTHEQSLDAKKAWDYMKSQGIPIKTYTDKRGIDITYIDYRQ